MTVELETIQEFDDFWATNAPLRGVVLQDLDLRTRTDALLTRDLDGLVLLGCVLAPAARIHAAQTGALTFPQLPQAPFRLHRSELYTAEELFDAFRVQHPESYAECFDARVYEHFKATGGDRPTSIVETLARSLHDHAMTDALEQLLSRPDDDGRQRPVVAIMGGHGMPRSDSSYREVAHIARSLARRGFLMASGGGPGAMEATHLGPWFADRSESDLDTAIMMLAPAPKYDHPMWLSKAFEVRQSFPATEKLAKRFPSLGIPTWLYGHEPPNVFATHIAKYFANSIREDGLLTIATHGVVFSPGSAGTIQEIFQDACQNHYEKGGRVSPMIFFGTDYWTRQKPVYPLLKSLAFGRAYDRWLTITDDPEEVVAALESYREAHP